MASDTLPKPVSEEKDAVDLGSVTADATSSNDIKVDNGSVSNGHDGDQVAGSAGSVGDSSETQATQISMRTLIVTSDASIIIGKSGKHINEIRDKSNARLNIVSVPSSKLLRQDAMETDPPCRSVPCRAKSSLATLNVF